MHVKPQNLDNSILNLTIRTRGHSPISGECHIENLYCILFLWGCKKKKSHICGPLKFEFSMKVVGPLQIARTHYVPRT